MHLSVGAEQPEILKARGFSGLEKHLNAPQCTSTPLLSFYDATRPVLARKVV